MRRRCPEQKIDQTRFSAGRAAAANNAIVLNDNVDNSFSCFNRVVGELTSEIHALHGNRGHNPPDQPGKGDQNARENNGDGPATAEFATAKLRQEWIEQIGKNHGNRDWDQNWLKKADEVSADIDDGDRDHDQQHDRKGGERGPDRPFLPGCWISTHPAKVISLS